MAAASVYWNGLKPRKKKMTELFFAVLGLVIKVLIVFAFLWFVAWLCGFDPRTATAFEKIVQAEVALLRLKNWVKAEMRMEVDREFDVIAR